MKFLSWSVALAGAGALDTYAVLQSATHGGAARAEDALEPLVGEEIAAVTAAPNVPPPITRKHATKERLDIEVKEHTKTLAEGVTYTYWTFGDDAPGNFIRVREG